MSKERLIKALVDSNSVFTRYLPPHEAVTDKVLMAMAASEIEGLARERDYYKKQSETLFNWQFRMKRSPLKKLLGLK